MVLTREQMSKLDAESLMDYAESLGNVTEQISKLEEKIDRYAGELTLVKNANILLKQHNTKVEERVVSLEKELARTSQYTLNRQFELHRVPDSIPQEELQSKVCEFMSLTGVDIRPSQIDKCHRLKKKTSVVVEFKVREDRDPVLFARKKLKNRKTDMENIGMKDVILTESMCFPYQKLDFLCRKLKSAGKANDTWFFNGKLFIVPNDEKKQVCHINDLFSMFGEETVLSFLSPRQ